MKNYNSYIDTLKLIMLKAISNLYTNNKCVFISTVNHFLYGEIEINEKKVSAQQIEEIKKYMQKLIDAQLEINLISDNLNKIENDAIELKRSDVTNLIENSLKINIYEYELDGYKDFFYRNLLNNTKEINYFDLIKYNNGFVLKYPIKDFGVKRELKDKNIMLDIFKKTRLFNEILDVDFIGSLNKKIMQGEIEELIRINEALHNNTLASISYKIYNNKNIKLVTIAGPSSSGKTTFSNKLYLSLRAFGMKPIVISLDNYYIGRKNIPRDKDGNLDFETIKALDIDLLNKNLIELMKKGETELPIYNFISGEREKFTKNMKLEKDGIIIIEGIHGLNEELTYKIKKDYKFKIYVSCLSQLNIDEHNRVSTTDVRKIRRIVRDSLSRSTNAENTLEMWDRVRAGEEKYIFPYQEDADILFNSNLIYELAVLKYPAIKELLKIKKDSKMYEEARRLINLLECFISIETHLVPDDSLLKEFIGDSFFYNY